MHTGQKAIVVGAGIVGLATARALSIKGFKVTVIDKTQEAIGASIRNFGMLWPVGQPDGALYSRAKRSKEIWLECLKGMGLAYNACGSVHLAYHQDEWDVLNEMQSIFSDNHRPVSLLTPSQIGEKFSGINQRKLMGGLYSDDEVIIDPRAGIKGLPVYLHETYGVEFIWGTAITQVSANKVASFDKSFEADIICICSGSDFETLYPSVFASLPITKSRLQMMRFVHENPSFKIGTSVCGGLSLLHYKSFAVASTLPVLKARIDAELSEYVKHGIHVMVSQNANGELTVGDTHEYGLDFDPFDNHYQNQLILDYLKKMMHIDDWRITQSWNGIYPTMKNGDTDLFLKIESGIYILNGIGGHGMTMSFGFAEEMINKL
jgi:FAD dependent oxidoreductase TIGR03364